MSAVVPVAGLELIIHTRDEWIVPSRPVTGPPANRSLVGTVVAHYPGAGAGWKPEADVAGYLRWQHDMYLVDRGYSYGYGYVIGPNGWRWVGPNRVDMDVWEVRGLDIQNAANGPTTIPGYSNFNPYSTAAQIMCSDAYPPTPEQRDAFRYLTAWLDGIDQRVHDVIGHADVKATACPGPVAPYLPELRIRPEAPPTQGDDDVNTPTTIRRGDRYDQFARGDDGGLWTRSYVEPSPAWSGWAPLGGKLAGSPTVAIDGNNVHIWARGLDDRVWQISWKDGAWTPWQDVGPWPASAA